MHRRRAYETESAPTATVHASRCFCCQNRLDMAGRIRLLVQSCPSQAGWRAYFSLLASSLLPYIHVSCLHEEVVWRTRTLDEWGMPLILCLNCASESVEIPSASDSRAFCSRGFCQLDTISVMWRTHLSEWVACYSSRCSKIKSRAQTPELPQTSPYTLRRLVNGENNNMKVSISYSSGCSVQVQ